MRKILSFLLAVLLVCNLCVPALAAPTTSNTFYIEADKASVAAGETVTVSIYSNTAYENMMSASVLVDYDESIFTLDTENSSVAGSARRWKVVNNTTDQGQGKYSGVVMYDADSETAIPNGLLGTLVFTANTAVESTSFTPFLVDAAWYDWDSEELNDITATLNKGEAVSVAVTEAPKEEEPSVDAPFSVSVNGQNITAITQDTVTWTSWSGSTSEVTRYLVSVPAGASEATLGFDSEKQWFYYASNGEYVGAGNTSNTASTEHTVAIQDSNADNELDGISVQTPNAWSTDYFIQFQFAQAQTCTVTLPENPVGYTIETEDSTTVEAGKTFSFQVNIDEAYEGTPVVKAGTEILTAVEGVYTVTVNEDVTITVEGITAKPVNYTVTLPENPVGYSIETSDSTTVEAGNTFSFQVKVAGGYEGTPVVKAGTETLPAVDGVYTVTVNADVTITVEGISEISYEGYGVSASEDKTIKAGETAQVKITVTADSEEEAAKIFNAYDLTLTYDPAKLNFVSGTAADTDAEIDAQNGTIRIMGYGADKNVNTVVATLNFTGKTTGSSEVVITAAKVDIGAHAISADAPEAQVVDSTTVITVDGYTVTLGDGLEADSLVAQNGVDYIVQPTKSDNYTYTKVSATIGEGENQTTIEQLAYDAEKGGYVIPGSQINGNISVTATMTPKEYLVTLNGEDVKGENKAYYGTDYIFTVDKDDDYNYTVLVTINNKTYTSYGVNDNKTEYTIYGTDITGPIVITVNKTEKPDQPENTVSVNKPAFVEGAANATIGQNYTFTVPDEEGYTYGNLTVTVAGTDITSQVTKGEDGTYTIPGTAITGSIVIEIERTLAMDVKLFTYITLDEKVMYLVTAAGELAEGHVAKYHGENMYWSEKYDAYAYLVISDKNYETMLSEAAAEVTVGAGEVAGTVSYSGDVNMTNVVDINDAQLTYDMYNAVHESFDTVSMQKFLNADMNGSGNVNVDDAAAIVDLIP